MSVTSKLKCIILIVIKFQSLRLIYLISNYRKSISINRNECIFQIKMRPLNNY